MATTGQTDPREGVLKHLEARVRLNDEARQVIVDRLAKVDPAELRSAASLLRAQRSMDRLADHLTSGTVTRSSINANVVNAALRDLCPLFPIC